MREELKQLNEFETKVADINKQLKEYGLKIEGDKVVKTGRAYCINCEGYRPLLGFIFVEEGEQIADKLINFFMEAYPKDTEDVLVGRMDVCWIFKTNYQLAKVIKEMKIEGSLNTAEEEDLNQLLFHMCEASRESESEKISMRVLKEIIRSTSD